MTARFRLILVSVPAIAVAIVFEWFLGHRHDYTGHYLAGYGGTLMAMMVWMRTLSPSAFARWSALGNLPLCLGCILIGALTEATAFALRSSTSSILAIRVWGRCWPQRLP